MSAREYLPSMPFSDSKEYIPETRSNELYNRNVTFEIALEALALSMGHDYQRTHARRSYPNDPFPGEVYPSI